MNLPLAELNRILRDKSEKPSRRIAAAELITEYLQKYKTKFPH